MEAASTEHLPHPPDANKKRSKPRFVLTKKNHKTALVSRKSEGNHEDGGFSHGR